MRVSYEQQIQALTKQLQQGDVASAVASADGQVLNYQCLYAVGGGTIRNTGGFPQSDLEEVDACKGVFDWYFSNASGQYWKDLEAAGKQAKEYYTGKATFDPKPENLLIFDIDETVLSNVQSIRGKQYTTLEKKVGTSSHTVKHDEDNFAPALDAIKDVYLSAYNYGFSVAFITGRTEDGRAFTEENLSAEGFGVKCAEDDQGNAQRSTDGPCFIALHLRDLDHDMEKLASVYKPERRKTFVNNGYTIVGTFGDQYSDLEGEYPAVASWKLPNPMYYIL